MERDQPRYDAYFEKGLAGGNLLITSPQGYLEQIRS